jgi:CBS-domain-containing membrane protein
MEDGIEEELRIQEERAKPGATLSAETFMQPISVLCTAQDLGSVTPERTIGEVVRLMQRRHIGAVLVQEGDRLVGIVTERDVLLKVVGKLEDFEARSVAEIMTPDPEVFRRDDQIAYLLNAMRVGGFRHVPIIDGDGKPIHLISLRDVLAFLLENFPPHVLNIPSEPYRGKPRVDGG